MATREPNDFYPTPARLCEAIVDSVLPEAANLRAEWRVLEPSAGDGAFVRVLHSRGVRDVTALEPFHATPHHGSINERLEDHRIDHEGYDLIIGNPPFKHAEEHVLHMLDLVRPGGHVAMLLRMSFLGSKKRGQFLTDHPPAHVDIIRGRPSFSGDGRTDGAEYAVFHWWAGSAGSPPTLGWIEW